MQRPKERNEIGSGWAAAMVILLILLVVGLVLYLRLSAPLQVPEIRTSAVPLGWPCDTQLEVLRIRADHCVSAIRRA